MYVLIQLYSMDYSFCFYLFYYYFNKLSVGMDDNVIYSEILPKRDYFCSH